MNTKKMKRLMPTLREKKRYIVYEITSSSVIDKEKVFSSIEKSLTDFLGILGLSKVNPIIMKEKFNGKKGIIRINNPYKDEVITALSLINDFKINVINVSGILNKIEI